MDMQIVQNISMICGTLVAIWSVLGIVTKIREIIKKTDTVQNSRLDRLEHRLTAIEDRNKDFLMFFDNGKRRIDHMTRSTAVMSEALLALLDHSINGNNIEQMKEARDNLYRFYTQG